jgi:hypothetical protein
MTRIFGLCPRCKSRIKINNVERLDGHKILCRDCGYTIRIRNPKRALVRRQSDDAEVFDIDESDLIEDSNPVENEDDEFAVAIDEEDDLPAYQPLLYRSVVKKKPAEDTEDEPAGGLVPRAGTKGDRKQKKNPLLITLALLGGLALVGLAAGGLYWMKAVGIGKAKKFEPPQNYETFAPKELELSAKVPEGWTTSSGGGQAAIPIFARFSSGPVSVEVRESVSGGALGQAAIATQGANPEVPREAPVVGIHVLHKRDFEEIYSKYNETFGRPITTRGYGEGRISDFTASEGLFGTPIKGCRATMMNSIHQFTVTCKCPASQFKDWKPVFEKIVESISTGGY